MDDITQGSRLRRPRSRGEVLRTVRMVDAVGEMYEYLIVLLSYFVLLTKTT